MPPKRKLENDAMVYFVDAVARLPEAPRAQQNARDALQEAHKWGQAMLQAEVESMRSDGIAPAARLSRLDMHAKRWYLRGYQRYPTPGGPDFPRLLRDRRGELPPAMRTLSVSALRNIAFQETEKWLPGLRSTRVHEAAVQERNDDAKKNVTPPKPQAPPNPQAPRLPVPQRRSATATNISLSLSTELALPPEVAATLANPNGGNSHAALRRSTPTPSMHAEVEAMLREQRVLRVWGDDLRLEALDVRACTLQKRLERSDLCALFGEGEKGRSVMAEDKRLGALGLEQLARGGFNTIWTASREASVLRVFPEEVRKLFAAKRVVLRSPLVGSKWLTFEELVGEVHNIVFTASTKLGPRVAAISYARKLGSCKSSRREGSTIALYKLFAFLERAECNTDQRYVSTAIPTASALHKPYYFSALLVSIHHISREGYVHLDATLRNFVDFYPATLGRTASAFAVRVIDVDAGCFRRLRGNQGDPREHLFLFNLLFVLISLKVRLADRWVPARHWQPVRACVDALIESLPFDGSAGIASRLRWGGVFKYPEEFPDIKRGKLAGDTDEAATGAANALLRFYLLQQPLNEALTRYVNYVAPNAEKARAARAWYDQVYREEMLPPVRFFLDKLTPDPMPSRATCLLRFVDVAREFLTTPHATLQQRYLRSVPLSSAHTEKTSQERMLGLVP